MSGYYGYRHPGYTRSNWHNMYDEYHNGYWYEDVQKNLAPARQPSYYSEPGPKQEGVSDPNLTSTDGSHYAWDSDHHDNRRRTHVSRGRDRDAYAHHSHYVVNESSSSSSREPRVHRAPVEYDREFRSVTPPPPRSPSPTYLALTEGSSSHLIHPIKSRKLLVLDLNGTLVFRSSPRKTKYPLERIPGENPKFIPRLRPVHPRPYMPTFRSYLFAPETRAWLDVMVWSSAQPHSVNDMVEHCFRQQKEHLVAVWARDTLGLSENHYKRKVQTVKDLAKPWLQLPLLVHRTSSPDPSAASIPHANRSLSPVIRDSIAPSNHQAHSALTTLLLDDSPRKAELQPYNHVCIGEYSAERRAKDLEIFTKEWEAAQQAAEAESEENQDEYSAPRDDVEVKNNAAEDASVSKKRKRKDKKLKKRAALLETQKAMIPAGPYDETLLAVVGVLNAIKHQSNVAAWIRAGGLWGPVGVSGDAPTRKADIPSAAPSSHPIEDKQRVEASLNSSYGRSSLYDDPQYSADTQMPGAKKHKRKHLRDVTDANDSHDKAGNDAVVVAAVASQSSPHPIEPTADVLVDTEISPSPTMWFEHPATISFWSNRGREALQELRIPVEHGIER